MVLHETPQAESHEYGKPLPLLTTNEVDQIQAMLRDTPANDHLFGSETIDILDTNVSIGGDMHRLVVSIPPLIEVDSVNTILGKKASLTVEFTTDPSTTNLQATLTQTPLLINILPVDEITGILKYDVALQVERRNIILSAGGEGIESHTVTNPAQPDIKYAGLLVSSTPSTLKALILTASKQPR